MPLPVIALIGTGGTISAVGDARKRSGPAGLGAEAIADTAGDLSGLATVLPIECGRVPGRAMNLANMREFARLVTRLGSEGECDGIVLTHGTDTMEESVYALAAMVEMVVPVVVTGAMRLPAAPGHDGGANLRTALTAAADGRLTRLGPVVAFADEIHLARWVTKADTHRPAPFTSPGAGRAGIVVEDKVILDRTDDPDDYLGLPDPGAADRLRVRLLTAWAGLDGETIERVAQGADGLVIAGTGGGHTSPGAARALGRLCESGMPVVIASRCASGPVLRDTYGGEGSEVHLRELGVLPAGYLPALKARLRLHIALALGLPADTVFPTDLSPASRSRPPLVAAPVQGQG